MNINLNFTLDASVSPDMMRMQIANIEDAVQQLKDKGIIGTATPISITETPIPQRKAGYYETLFLENKGLKRMKVPTSWSGSREEFAMTCLGVVYHKEILTGIDTPPLAPDIDVEEDSEVI